VVQRLSQSTSVSCGARSDSLYKASFKAHPDKDLASPRPASLSNEPALTALPRSKFSGARHFETAKGEEIEVEQVVNIVSCKKTPTTSMSPRACIASAGAASMSANVSHSAVISSILSVTSGDGNTVPVNKESAGFRSKRKSFGAPPMPVQQAPPQDWLE